MTRGTMEFMYARSYKSTSSPSNLGYFKSTPLLMFASMFRLPTNELGVALESESE